MKFSTKNLRTWLTAYDAVQVPITLSAVTKTKPALATAVSPGTLANGQFVKVSGTGMASIDDKFFMVANLGGDTIVATVAGTASATATITFSGGPAGSNGSLVLAGTIGGTPAAISGLTSITINRGDTTVEIAAVAAAMLNNKIGGTYRCRAVAAGSVVTVTEVAGGNVATLTATVTGTTATANQFELKCSDASLESAAATSGTAIPFVKGTDLVPFCINSLEREVPAGEVIDLGTFCDPTAQVSGDASSGTLSWGGPIDFADLGFQEMQKALGDGVERILVVEFPQDIGHMFIPVTINSYSESFAFRGAATWTGGAVVNSTPQYVVC